jgi:creatinine amidohydrolase
MQLAELTWDATPTDPDAVLLPVGSTEQHGPHAPLGTDTLTAGDVARRAAARADGELLIAPAIPIGVAAEHRRFRGSLWVSADTFRAYVGEAVEALVSHDWDCIIIVNGHGGNVPALEILSAELTRALPARVVPFTWFDAVDAEYRQQMGHGGPIETAAVQAIAPSLIDESQLEVAAADGADRWGRWAGRTNLAVDTDEFTTSGAVGDPRTASAELGTSVLQAAVTELLGVVDAVAQL